MRPESEGERLSIWIRLIIAALFCLAVLFVIIVISTAVWLEEQKLEEKRKQIEEEKKIKQECITMCLRTRQANACPGVCNKCAWGRTEFRGKSL